MERSIQPATADAWRGWLQANHAIENEIWLVISKKQTGMPGLTLEEAAEEALCFGWVDSIMKRIDDETYAVRYTPRRKGSRWSEGNRARAAKLIEQGRMTEAGLAKLYEAERSAHTAVLVEGVSDQRAIESLAERRGRNLDAEGIVIVPMGGATNIRSFLTRFGPRGLDLRLAGLCDAAEEGDFRRGLERAELGSNLTRSDMEALGFFVCVEDLEDELIRSLGAEAVERIVDAHGELGSFRTMQKQPAWRGRTAEEQLRRFMGSGGRRKIRYARFLVEALDLTGVPPPLDGLLAYV